MTSFSILSLLLFGWQINDLCESKISTLNFVLTPLLRKFCGLKLIDVGRYYGIFLEKKTYKTHVNPAFVVKNHAENSSEEL